MLKVGIIGFGYWGPNLVRNFHAVEDAQVVMICDRDERALQRAHKMFPGVPTCSDSLDLLHSPGIFNLLINLFIRLLSLFDM